MSADTAVRLDTVATTGPIETPTALARMTAAPPVVAPDYMVYRQMIEFASGLVKSGFLPDAIKTPEQAVAIMLTGRELGIQTMHAFRSIHIIKGKPTLGAELQLGLFLSKGGRSRVIESTATVCKMWFRHPNGTEHTETFTIEDAKRAGLLTRSAPGKDNNWILNPLSMLRARCIAFAMRVLAPDIVAGLYDPDELEGADTAPALPETVRMGIEQARLDEGILYNPDDDGDDPAEPTLRAAASFPFPFKKSHLYGRLLGDISSETLHEFATWIIDKRAEPSKGPLFQSELYDHILVVLDARENGELPEPERPAPELTTTAAAAE